jgi:hypothetical protein
MVRKRAPAALGVSTYVVRGKRSPPGDSRDPDAVPELGALRIRTRDRARV